MPGANPHLRLLRALADTADTLTAEIAEHANGSHVRLTLHRVEALGRAVDRVRLGTPIPDELAERLAVDLEVSAGQPYLEAEDGPNAKDDHGGDDCDCDDDKPVEDARAALRDFKAELCGQPDGSSSAIDSAISNALAGVGALREEIEALAELAELAADPVELAEVADALGLERVEGRPRKAFEIVASAHAIRVAGGQAQGQLAGLRLRLRDALDLPAGADDDAIVLGVADVLGALAEVEGQRDVLAARIADGEAAGGNGRRRVFVASPFRADTPAGVAENVAYAVRAAADAFARGEAPFVPHLIYPRFMDDAIEAERNASIEAGIQWSRAAAAVVVYTDRGISAGMRIEIDVAEAEGRPVEYRTLEPEA